MNPQILQPMKNNRERASSLRITIGRRLVQTGFLLLFLFPWLPVLAAHFSGKDLTPYTSWLLPFDALANSAKGLHGDIPWIVVGSTLFILTGSWVFGRAFCGWICPLGTILDWIRPLAIWQKRQTVRPTNRNSRVRFYLLVILLTASFLSLQFVGWFDPLVIFNRAASALIHDLMLFDLSNLRLVPFFVSFIFLIILALELYKPRFWCRNICPFGALISLPARFSRLNRRVSNACTYCGECRNVCPMRAIGTEPHDTRYTDCTFCLECETVCPNQGIHFEFGQTALQKWKNDIPAKKEERAPEGSYSASVQTRDPIMTRRQAIETLVAGGIGLAVSPAIALATPRTVPVRPPGALPEARFLQTCILCQECVRICPSKALRPALLEAGITSIGTPILSPRQGACSFVTGCPQLCAQACPVGAIRPIAVGDMKVGIARVDHKACLAWDQGEKCLVCVEACLSEAAKSINGRIIIDAEKCTGCGRCESGCPIAGSAIRVYPL